MRGKSEHGVIAVEFAFLLPILITLVAGIIEFGFALYFQQVITNAGREAARAGIVIGDPRPNQTEIADVALAYMTNLGVSCDASCVSVSGSQGDSGEDLTVSLAVPYQFAILQGFIEGLIGDVTLRAAVTMKHE